MFNITDLKGFKDMDVTQKFTHGFENAAAEENAGKLDLSQLNMEIAIANIDQYPNDQYALLRKDGLGTSDSSIVLDVNPYTTKAELVAQKCRNYLTEEELEVGTKSAVRKGRELEPLIINKHSQILGRRIIKPVDMYKMKDFPHIRFNFDGVVDKIELDDGSYQYIPDEIKVVTISGTRNYQPNKATYRESTGWKELPENYSKRHTNIKTKASLYGIPPYYYTQLQQQILGLDAPYGFLTVLLERNWEIHSWIIWRDDDTIRKLIIEATKLWNIIEAKRPKDFDLGVKIISEEE